jgi:Fe2+ transport system protein B
VKLIQNRFQNVSILNRINQTLNTFNPEESGALRQRYISLYTNLVEADSRHSNKTTTDIKYEKELDTIREAVLLLQKDVQKIQFNKAMLFLENKSHLFQTKDPNSAAAKKCKAMVEALAQHARDYYKPNGTDLRQFVTQCKNTISEATSELQNHRGFWYSKVPGAIRKLLGVLSSPVFALSYSVGLCSWQSYKKTFFETPNTDSIIKISKFKESLQKITGESLEVDEENRDNIGLSGVGA